MLNEQNAVEVLIIGTGIAALIGAWVASVIFIDREEIDMKRKRKALRHGPTNYARWKAKLAVSGGTIKKW